MSGKGGAVSCKLREGRGAGIENRELKTFKLQIPISNSNKEKSTCYRVTHPLSFRTLTRNLRGVHQVQTATKLVSPLSS